VQEFVKVRKDDEREKEAMLAALVCRSFNRRAIVFCEMKKDAHR
jgi:ATP-dependent RNA helicase DDX27